MLSASTWTEEQLPRPDTHEEEPKPQPFNLHNSHHQALLREWCQQAWYGTIKKSIDSGNPVIYHECCFCFSRRAFSKKANHHSLQSSSVQKIPSFKSVESPEELLRWLLDKIRSHQKLGRRTIFPGINRYHCEDDQEDEEGELDTTMLAKRCEKLDEDLQIATKSLHQLQKDNERLLSSSKAWFHKYQELVLVQATTHGTEYLPQKPCSEGSFLIEE